jgi:putative Holliday junction resolvase
MKYLSIDYGDKRIGLAVCDPSETIVSPLKVLNNPEHFVEETADLIEDEKIEAVVIGIPFNMDGTEGRQVKVVERFAEQLKKKITIPIFFQDERLSTFAAEQKLVDIELSKKKKRERIDAIAAAHILEEFLERRRSI